MNNLKEWYDDYKNCTCHECTWCKTQFKLKIMEQCSLSGIDTYTAIYNQPVPYNDATLPLLKSFNYERINYVNINYKNWYLCVKTKQRKLIPKQMELNI